MIPLLKGRPMTPSLARTLRLPAIVLGVAIVSLFPAILPIPAQADEATPALFSLGGGHVPDEIDIGTGIEGWGYRETAGDTDSATLLEGHLRTLSYWGPVIVGADLSYMASFLGTYKGATIGTGQPVSMNMAETVFQSAGHLGLLVLNAPSDSLGVWITYGYHQQIWMTPAQAGGYEENYQIPYVGGAFYNQNPLPGTPWTFYEEGGYREALSPGMTIVPNQGQSLPSGNFTLGGAWNLHALVGVRYLLTPHVGLYLQGNYSYWAFTHSTNTLAAGGNSYGEPSSITTYGGVETGVTIEF